MNKLKQWLSTEENRTICYIAISGTALLLSFFHVQIKNSHVDLAWIAIILCGFPIIKDAFLGLAFEIDTKSFSSHISENKLLTFAASAESLSEHPLGRAIISYAKNKVELYQPQNFVLLPGRGVSTTVDNRAVIAGNREMFIDKNIQIPTNISKSAQKHINNGCTIIYVSIDNELIGFIALSDTLRTDAKSMVDRIHSLGINTLLLTGDNSHAASHMAALVGIGDVKAEQLPKDKMNAITYLQNNNEPICMVGDGVNDAQHSLLGNVLTRYSVCKRLGIKNRNLVFGSNEYRKPKLIQQCGIHFNISHSGNWVVRAVDNTPVGIDVELIRPIDFQIAEMFFSRDEYTALLNHPPAIKLKYFYMLWTLKESFIKAEGKGLSIPLDSLQ